MIKIRIEPNKPNIKIRVEPNSSNIKFKLKDHIVIDNSKKPQDKSVEYVENGDYLVQPDEGYALENVNVKVNVPIPEGYLKPEGNIDITDTEEHDVSKYATAQIKDENLKAENIAEGVEVLDIIGTFRGGIDTSDGTITPDKVLKNEIGYAKEQKVVGAIKTYDYSMENGILIPDAPVPEGNLDITENGTYDVTKYASANVDVPIPDGYLKPDGTLDITENGSYDVKSYENANINVAGGEECNGLPLEVEELPEVGIEGAFYKVVKTEEVNLVWMYAPSQQANADMKDLGFSYTLKIVDDFPNNPVKTTNLETINFYYIKNVNDLYFYAPVYSSEYEWITLQDLGAEYPFCGIVYNRDEFTEEGMYVLSETNTTTTLYLFENNEYMQVGDASLLPSGTIDITENGEIDIAKYEKANVNVDTSKPEQSKSATPTKNTQNIVPDTGYVLNKVTVNPIPEKYIIPSGTINITENGTYNITEKASAIVTIPEKQIILQDKVIDSNGTYSADEGYDGLGQVTVEVAGGTNTESEEVAGLLGNTMTTLDNSIVTSLRSRACQGATKLVTVNLPNVTSTGSYAFYQCSGLETVKLPKLTTISTQTFYSCTKLQHADCGQLGNIPAQTFNACSALTELILRKTNSICTLSNVNAVNNSPIGKGTGYVYVPSALIDTYKTATNWSTFADQFRAIEDYPDICGGV